MHSIYEMKFRRRFSINPYKTLRMKLGEMSCYKNWIGCERGDPYPILCGGGLTESLPGARYRAENLSTQTCFQARLLGQHFPYASYEIALDELPSGCSGVGVQIFAAGETGSDYDRSNEPCLRMYASDAEDGVCIRKSIRVGNGEEKIQTVRSGIPYTPGMRLIITSRGMFFDVYLQSGERPLFVCTFDVPEMRHILRYHTFMRTTAALFVVLEPNDSVQCAAEFYLDCGVSHADMKCMRYENGMPMMHEGRLFMTMSSRLGAGGFQSVISWNPSTADLRMEGALFFDLGDDMWCSDVASSVVFDRRTQEWYVWACAFSHGHILCHATSQADLRYGIHVLDAQTMPVEQMQTAEGADSLSIAAGGAENKVATLSDDTLFFAKSGDEDPDLVWDEARGKWLLTICRHTTENGKSNYRYFLFESDHPFEGFTFVDRTRVGSNTGGSIIRVGGELYLLCGSDFDQRSRYQLHPIHDLSKCTYMQFDYDDGGFRGWGTLIPILCGRRTRYVWMTFDRHNGSDYNWSYGNIYVFESDLMNDGWEWTNDNDK